MSQSYFNISKKINQLIIAFCGPSTCGKSSIIKEILNSYRSKSQLIKIVVLDHFFYDKNKLPKTRMRGKKVSNLDLKESIDRNAFYNRYVRCLRCAWRWFWIGPFLSLGCFFFYYM